MATIKVYFETLWKKEETDLRKCDTCKEIIFSNMYILVVKPVNQKKEIKKNETDFVICESCQSIIDDTL